MQILDAYTKKEYDCPKKCGSKVYYAKIADDSGKLVTLDGDEPNGKYGKDSNVLSGAVDVNVKDRIHSCIKADLEAKYSKLVDKPVAGTTTSTTTSATEEQPRKQVRVRWPEEPKQLSDLQSNLYHGYHDLTVVAYMLTKEQHPLLAEDTDTFGMIVHAKTLVLSNLVVSMAIKNQKTA